MIKMSNQQDLSQLTPEEILAQADALHAEISTANTNFATKTDALIKDLDAGIDEAEAEFAKAETELKLIERKTINELDEAVFTLLEEEKE
jgi:hypothetical protein